MVKSGYSAPAAAFRAKAWSLFGRKTKRPVYGAIGIKTRQGGGHVAFVVGQSSDGRYLYMLGGNQNDEVNISRYPKNVWTDFVLPWGYDASRDGLPILRNAVVAAGRES